MRFEIAILAVFITFNSASARDTKGYAQTDPEMHRWFEEALATQPVPWRLLRGSREQRLREALALIRESFRGSAWRPPA